MEKKNLPMKALIRWIEREIGLYDRLLHRMEDHHAAVMGGDVDGLLSGVTEKKELLSEIRQSAAVRSERAGRMAEGFGLKAQEASLKELARRMPPAEASRLMDCRRRLLQRVDAVSAANRKDRALIEHAIGLARGMRTFLENLRTPPQVYRHTGSVQELNRTTGKKVSDRA